MKSKNKRSMVKKIGLMFVILLSFNIQAQEASVEKSIFGVQAGIMGVWLNNEVKLSSTVALRSEVGFRATNLRIGNPIYSRGNEPFIPLVLTIEPRWYYDIKKRHSRGLCIANNSATFVSLKLRHHAGWLMLSGKQPSNIQIIPMYGLRGSIGQHFNYEIGVGIGYQHTFTSVKEEIDVWAFNIVLRIGYTF